MSDETQGADVEEPAGPLAGQRLAAARREREISIHEIAKELHLDEPKVQALEENRFDVLGAPVFAKGHLRKYAELVGVSVDDVLTDYYSMNRSVGAPPVVGLKRKRPRDIRLGPWIAAVLLIAAVAAAGYWWLNREATGTSDGGADVAEGVPDEPMVSSSGAVTVPVPDAATADAAGAEAEADPDPLPAEPDAAEDDVADLLPGTQVVNRSLPSTGGPQVTFGMTFSGDCWTEVTDANGERLYFDLGREGRTVSVSGEAPLRVLFGNANNVSVTVDGNDFAITDAMRRGETARLTINAQ